MTLLQYRPMRRFILVCGFGALAAAACSKKSSDGLPAATEWQAVPGTAPSGGSEVVPHITPPRGMGRDPANPHAGLAMGGDPSNPHAGLDMDGDPSNPHAGMDMSQNPHGGGGTDVTKLGLTPPDPDRPIDPKHRVTGVISVDAKAKDRVKPGTSVFLIVKRASPDGTPSGPALAVDKLAWAGEGVAFELTDAQAMVAGTELRGDVIVMARYDQDSDALSKEPGDITGQVRVTIPADHVKLALDTVLP
jgi:cytochrome c-type biogenesis protein CcmH